MVDIQAGSAKICGLRHPDDARCAADAGADLIGFIFAPARRQVTPQEAATAIEAARAGASRIGRSVLAVGVFVDAPPELANAVADVADLDLIQAHGDEPADWLPRYSRPVIKALRLPAGMAAAEAREQVAPYRQVANAPVAFLVDGFHPAQHGGMGVRADWAVAAELAGEIPLVLAGGLDAANVGEAIAAVRPLAVDVSSGVETGGDKDQEKIRAFLLGAKARFAELKR